jgi:hypothetical protein
VFDVTLTDIEFNKDFVNKQSDWIQAARPAEPDLAVYGLEQSFASRLFALIGLS